MTDYYQGLLDGIERAAGVVRAESPGNTLLLPLASERMKVLAESREYDGDITRPPTDTLV